jgi:Carbohydrate-binding domain-containing protein Cthe_2159
MRLPSFRHAVAGTLAAAMLVGCGTSVASDTTTSTSPSSATSSASSSASSSTSAVVTTDGTTVEGALADNVEVETGDTSYDEADAIEVTLSGTSAESDSDAVTSEDGTVTISAAGTYVLSGNLTGQVVVNSTEDGVVRLVLDDASIASDSSAAINVVDAESVVVVLADGSSNSLSDAATYDDTSDEAPTGALYSTADLTIGGTGSLTVTGNANNGIVGKDGLVITGGTIEVTSVDDGIIGKDYLAITDGDVTVDSIGDAIKSDNTEDAGSGFVLIQGGTVTVSTQDDGIKGVQVLVAGGTIDVAESNEAMEGSLIIIDDGDIELHSADDGVNVSTSDDSAATDGQAGQSGGMGGGMEADSSLNLVINGGTLEVWSSGDGLDSNGSATITGGDIVVYGPTTDGNGALDVNGTFEITGGTLMAAGSSGMMVAPSTDSDQGWLATALSGTATAGSEVVITDADGTEVATYTIAKDFASVVFSSADIEQGATYTVTVDGTSTEVTAGVAPAGGRGPM